jgi:hypothetical protein
MIPIWGSFLTSKIGLIKMTRQITEQAAQAFNGAYNFKLGATEVTILDDDGMTVMRLHGNTIAFKHDGVVKITNSGWATNVTKERLNGLEGVSIVQRKGVWYLNDNEWGGEWIIVKRYQPTTPTKRY